MIRLRTLGGLSLERTDPKTAPLLQRRPLALLAVLAVAGELGVSREKLLAYFWPDSDEDRARNVLRQLMHTIRRDLGLPNLFVGTSELRLDAALMTTDSAEFELACRAGEYETAVALYRGPFLDGFYLSNAAGFESWKESERARCARRFVEAAERAGRAASAVGDHARALTMWQRLAVEEPLNSRIAAELMRALTAAGDLGGALKHARVHEAVLREEIGGNAAAEFRRVADELATRSSPTREPTAHAALADDARGVTKPSIDIQVSEVRLRPGGLGPGIPATRPQAQSILKARWKAATLVLVGGSTVAALLPSLRPSTRHVALAESSYVVLPVAGPVLRQEDRRRPDRALREALSRWDGVRVVDPFRVDELVPEARKGSSLSAALSVSRTLRARHLVWVRSGQFRDTVDIEVLLYDVRDATLLRERRLRLTEPAVGLADSIDVVAREILLGTIPLPVDAGWPLAGTSRVVAWRAYAAGRDALRDGDPSRAGALFRDAVREDPEFALARLWLAQVAAWSGPELADEARQAALRAVALRHRLSTAYALRAAALSTLAEGDYPGACGLFRELIALDSLDFGAWYGLGDCQSRDSTVVRDWGSVSGWRFRSSYHGAIRAYTRALELMPSLNFAFGGDVFGHLTRLLFTEAWRYRPGEWHDGDSTLRFGAFPAVGSDTLAFIPFPIADFREGRLRGTDATHLVALTRNRAILVKLFRRWALEFPSSPEALEAYALSLELVGRIGSADSGSAVRIVDRALSLAADSARAMRLRLRIMQVRLTFKTGDAATARAIGDTILRTWHDANPEEAAALAGVAALLGRVNDAAAYLAASARAQRPDDTDGQPVVIAASLNEAACRLLVFASFGFPAESLAAAYERVENQIRAYVDPARQASVRAALVRRPLRLSYGLLASIARELPEPDGDPIVEVQRAIRARDFASARRTLDRVMEHQRHLSSSDIALDQVLQEAVAYLELGDTITTTALLDNALEALPGSSVRLLSIVPTAAAAVRAMALRAELASRAGDRLNARRWGQAVATLWSAGDVENRVVSRRALPLGSMAGR